MAPKNISIFGKIIKIQEKELVDPTYREIRAIVRKPR